MTSWSQQHGVCGADDRQFHHWWDGGPVATAVHLGPADMDWLLVDAWGQELRKRPSWDSSQALISLDSSCSFIKVPQPLHTTKLLLMLSGALLAGRMLFPCLVDQPKARAQSAAGACARSWHACSEHAAGSTPRMGSPRVLICLWTRACVRPWAGSGVQCPLAALLMRTFLQQQSQGRQLHLGQPKLMSRCSLRVPCLVGVRGWPSSPCQHHSNPWLQVWMPWAHLLVGEAQFRCVMSFLWENMYEDADFGPPRPAVYPTGVQPPQQMGLRLLSPMIEGRGLRVEGLGPWAGACIESALSCQRQKSVSAAAACSLHACSAGR